MKVCKSLHFVGISNSSQLLIKNRICKSLTVGSLEISGLSSFEIFAKTKNHLKDSNDCIFKKNYNAPPFLQEHDFYADKLLY